MLYHCRHSVSGLVKEQRFLLPSKPKPNVVRSAHPVVALVPHVEAILPVPVRHIARLVTVAVLHGRVRVVHTAPPATKLVADSRMSRTSTPTPVPVRVRERDQRKLDQHIAIKVEECVSVAPTKGVRPCIDSPDEAFILVSS